MADAVIVAPLFLLLSRWLRLSPGWCCGRLLSSCLLEQRQRICGVKRVFADGFLARRAQGDVYATIAGQEDRLHVVENSLALLWSQFGILLNRIFDLGFVEVSLLSEGLGF